MGSPPSITFMKVSYQFHEFFILFQTFDCFFFLKILQGKSTTVLELEHNVLDFLVATDTPYINDYQDPKSILAMLTNDIVAIGENFEAFSRKN